MMISRVSFYLCFCFDKNERQTDSHDDYGNNVSFERKMTNNERNHQLYKLPFTLVTDHFSLILFYMFLFQMSKKVFIRRYNSNPVSICLITMLMEDEVTLSLNKIVFFVFGIFFINNYHHQFNQHHQFNHHHHHHHCQLVVNERVFIKKRRYINHTVHTHSHTYIYEEQMRERENNHNE